MDISVVSVFLLIMNNTALNIHVYLFVSTYIFSYLEYKKKLVFVGHVLILCLTF